MLEKRRRQTPAKPINCGADSSRDSAPGRGCMNGYFRPTLSDVNRTSNAKDKKKSVEKRRLRNKF
jgi:hypothetical protein